MNVSNFRVCQLAAFLALTLRFTAASPLDVKGQYYPGVSFGRSIFKERSVNVTNCLVYVDTDIWTTCLSFITLWNVTLPYFVGVNPIVRADCSAFVPGDDYCLIVSDVVPISTDGVCGTQAASRVTCVGSTFGNCCSTGGRCGSTDAYCVLPNCQDGRCQLSATTSVSTASTTSATSSATAHPAPFSPSPDGTCGYVNKYKCTGTNYYYGNCCSAAGYCGLDQYACSNLLGCQSEYGLCDTTVIVTVTLGNTGSSTVASATTTSSGVTTSSKSTSATSTSSYTLISSTSSTSSSALSTATGPVYVAKSDDFSLMGCYAEPASTRALGNSYNNAAMTIEMCATYAAAYSYFGVEYGVECWYGNNLDAGSTLGALTSCSFLCPGNSLEYCGAGNYLIMYSKAGAVSIPATTLPAYAGFSLVGCASEAVGARLLPNLFTSTVMTVELCINTAISYGATWAGIEYGGECWYGTAPTSTPVLSPITSCNMLCTGSTTEYCGAGNLLTLYQKTT